MRTPIEVHAHIVAEIQVDLSGVILPTDALRVTVSMLLPNGRMRSVTLPVGAFDHQEGVRIA